MVENKHLKNIGLHNKTSDANLEKGQKTMMTKLRRGEKKNTNKRNNVEWVGFFFLFSSEKASKSFAAESKAFAHHAPQFGGAPRPNVGDGAHSAWR